jgi:hypothetical protein
MIAMSTAATAQPRIGPRGGSLGGPRFVVAPVVVVAVVIGWITVVLVLDADGGRWLQRLLGLATWAALGALLTRAAPLVRVQTMVVVAFATAVEFTFSPLLGIYTYRFHNVPMYVPPGHGLVYLAALAIGALTLVRAQQAQLRVLVVALGAGYATVGLVGSGRTDVLGAFWYACLIGFLFLGPSVGLYLGAAVVVTYLELLGTSLGTWVWQPHDPTGLVSIGNPPSGAAGGYGWFDLAALLAGPRLLAWCRSWRTADSHAPPC